MIERHLHALTMGLLAALGSVCVLAVLPPLLRWVFGIQS
jgi:hypothetical protein